MKQTRLRLGLSRVKAARSVGIHRDTYVRFETGRTVRPSDVNEHKIQQWLETNAAPGSASAQQSESGQSNESVTNQTHANGNTRANGSAARSENVHVQSDVQPPLQDGEQANAAE